MAVGTISSGQSLSAAIDLGIPTTGSKIVGFIMPAAWTAASLNFQVSNQLNGTYVVLTDDAGTEVSLTVSASKGIGLRKDQSDVLGRWRFIKLQSGSSGAPITQLGDRTIQIEVK